MTTWKGCGGAGHGGGGKISKVSSHQTGLNWLCVDCHCPYLKNATEGEGATPKDAPHSATTPSMSVQLVISASDSPSATTFGIPENLIHQCQNLPEGKKVYLCHWEDWGSDSTKINTDCKHVR